METSDSEYIVIGRVGAVFSDAEGLIVVLEFISLYVGVVGADGVFDRSLEGLTTMTEGFHVFNCDISIVFTIYQLLFRKNLPH